jgi:hypothetical protein
MWRLLAFFFLAFYWQRFGSGHSQLSSTVFSFSTCPKMRVDAVWAPILQTGKDTDEPCDNPATRTATSASQKPNTLPRVWYSYVSQTRLDLPRCCVNVGHVLHNAFFDDAK